MREKGVWLCSKEALEDDCSKILKRSKLIEEVR